MAGNDLLSGSITFTGLGSGTDFTTMIEQLIEVESVNKQRMELWKKDWESRIEGLQALNSSLLTLKTDLSSIDTLDEFVAKTVDSVDATVVTATADSEAQEGTHSVQVFQMAQAAIITTAQGFADTTVAVNTSGGVQAFAYDYMGETYSLNIASGTTLEQLKDAINADPANPGVRADLISDGSSYYLQMRGKDLGSGATLSFNAAATSMSNGAFDLNTDFITTQQNQSSLVKVDGWPTAADQFISTDSNTLTGVVPGLTFSLKGVGGPTTLTINTDTETIKENIRAFVNDMNEVRRLGKELTAVDTGEDTASGSVLTGNYGVQLVLSNLKQAVSSIAKGFTYYNENTDPPTGDIVSSLSQLGILTDADDGSATSGELVLDEELLDEVLAANPDAVAEVFAADGIRDEDVVTGNFSFYSDIGSITSPGSYDVSYDIDANGNIVNAFINGVAANVDNTEKTLTAMGGDNPAEGAVVKVNEVIPGTSGSGRINLKQGKAGELVDMLKDYTSEVDGPLNIISDNYESIIDNIDKKIEKEEVRLAQMAYNLRLKFARLEATLGTYDQINTSLGNQINQLPSGSS